MQRIPPILFTCLGLGLFAGCDSPQDPPASATSNAVGETSPAHEKRVDEANQNTNNDAETPR